MSAPIVQFGTSRFLQAHVDLMLSEAADEGQVVGPVTVVETTGSPASRSRIAAFAGGTAYDVRIRGLQDGKPVDVTKKVKSVAGGLSARTDFPALRDVFCEAAYVVSNTGDRGYRVPSPPSVDENGWRSFPELLTLLLKERFGRSGRPVTVIPCELVPRNGAVLRDIVDGVADQAGLEPAFREWLRAECIWCNSLVDRIVSEPLDPVGAVAEPYALWAIERQPGFVPPCRHADLKVVDDITPYEQRKLFMLNLAHTLLAQRWRDRGGAADETVRAMIAEPETRAWLSDIVESEVVPAFENRQEAQDYWLTCLERFANPYLDHRLADIAQNHEAKIERRAGEFIRWATRRGDGGKERFPKLRGVLPLT